MRISETYKLQQPQMLTGLFKDGKAIYQAREVLTDFGYPKDAASVTEVNRGWYGFKGPAKHALHLMKSRFLVGIIVGAVIAIVAGVSSQAQFYPMMTFFQGGLFLLAWVLIALVAALVCGLIGALLLTAIYAFIAEKYEGPPQEANGQVLIRIAVRTPSDAADIAREWEEIGGKVV